MVFENKITAMPFWQWLRFDKENKLLLIICTIVATLHFLIFKFLYPYPNFMPPDSYNYLEAALRNDSISIWPIGYSKFLRIVNGFTYSDVTLVWIQYFCLQICLIYFLFSIRYLFGPGKWSFRILLGLNLLNPMLPHISNFISSDCLFLTLSLLWFTQVLWIIYKPSNKLLIGHSFVLLLTIMVRYYALFYPFITIPLILLCRMPRFNKLIGITSISILLILVIGFTQHEYKQKTGKVQFSAFGGWQMAANALYGYSYAPQDSPNTVPVEFNELHSFVNQHNKNLSRLPHFLRPDYKIGVYYLWDFNSPLVLYREKLWQEQTTVSYFKKWAHMAPLYKRYGQYLISKHPNSFIKHYIWPNCINYFAPPTGFLDSYVLGSDTVSNVAVRWFNWKNNMVTTRFKTKEIQIAPFFTAAMGLINILFVLSLLGFIILLGFKNSARYNKSIILLAFFFWLGNIIWSVFTAPIELRYQLFPMIMMFTILGFLISYIIDLSLIKKPDTLHYKKYNLSQPR